MPSAREWIVTLWTVSHFEEVMFFSWGTRWILSQTYLQEIVATIDRCTSPIKPVIWIERIDDQSFRIVRKRFGLHSWVSRLTFHHPPYLLVPCSRVNVINTKPWCKGIRIWVVFRHSRVPCPCPERRPRSSTVGWTKDLTVGPPRVQCCDHNSSRFLEINCDTTESKVKITARDRSNVGPC